MNIWNFNKRISLACQTSDPFNGVRGENTEQNITPFWETLPGTQAEGVILSSVFLFIPKLMQLIRKLIKLNVVLITSLACSSKMCDLGTCFLFLFVFSISLLALVLLQVFYALLFEVLGEVSCGPNPSMIRFLQVVGRGESMEEAEQVHKSSSQSANCANIILYEQLLPFP